ncbi:alpha-1-acid glycoprotein 1 [Saccopteryx leptura]|uniref:alpha-1-acid glycoprotein 1 n=1 Tax=Saccopteryx leptura TaxID=249018 RepID=UPI00339BEE5E
MALAWALAVFSLLSLSDAQSPTCTNITETITNATLDQLQGKWFYIAAAYRNPEYRKMASDIHAAFFYFDTNYTEDMLPFREYMTVGEQCNYTSESLTLHRENGTLSRYENGREHFGFLMLPKDPKIYMLAAFPGDKQNMGLSFFADKPEVTQEQMEQFYEDLRCMGMDKSEVVYTDEKKDRCQLLEKQHNEERKKESDGSKPDTASD